MLLQMYRWFDNSEFDLNFLIWATVKSWRLSHLCFSVGDLFMHINMCACVQMESHTNVYVCTCIYIFFLRLQLAVFGPRIPFWHRNCCTVFPFPSFNIFVYTYIVAADVASSHLLYCHIVIEIKNYYHSTDKEVRNRNIKDSWNHLEVCNRISTKNQNYHFSVLTI